MIKLFTMRFFVSIICSVFQLFGIGCVMGNTELIESINNVSYFVIYDNGEQKIVEDGVVFDEIKLEICQLLKNSREMPAFCVSLHNETLQSMQKGLWLEMVFDKYYVHSEMLFSRLLINVNKDWTGFNIIRFYNGKYEGRCYYFDLINANMDDLYNTILSVLN